MSAPTPEEVRRILKAFPGISRVRASQIARDRQVLLRRAAKQAQRNLYGPVEAGGIGQRDRALIDSFEEAR